MTRAVSQGRSFEPHHYHCATEERTVTKTNIGHYVWCTECGGHGKKGIIDGKVYKHDDSVLISFKEVKQNG